MSVLRARQPALTRVLPHPGNKRWALGGPRSLADGLDHRWVFEFDGLASQIVTDINPPDGIGAFEVLIRPDLMAANMYVMGGKNNVNSFQVQTSGQFVMQRSAESTLSGTGKIVLGQAYTLKGTWEGAAGSGDDQYLFIDGVELASETIGTNAARDITRIGCRATDGQCFNGVIANAKFWLSTDDTNTEPEYFFKIDEGNGTTILNYGSAGGTQTLTEGAGSWVFNP